MDVCTYKCSPFAVKNTVSTEGNVEIYRPSELEEERPKDHVHVYTCSDEQFRSLATFQLSTSAMLFCEFDSLVGSSVAEQPNMKVMCLYEYLQRSP